MGGYSCPYECAQEDEKKMKDELKPKPRLKKPASLFVTGVKVGMIFARRYPGTPLHEIFTNYYGSKIIQKDIDDDVFLSCVEDLRKFEDGTHDLSA